MIRRFPLPLVLLAILGWQAATVADVAADQPNIIFILSDDQGIGDVGVYGNPDIATPNLDRLAAGGVRFDQFYANASVCSPSRAAVLTGQVPQRAGVPGNVPPPPWGQKGLPTDKVTIADLLKQQGYRTAQIGKWHLGSAAGLTPLDQGFDYSFGFRGGVVDNYSHFFYWNGPNRHDLQRNNREIHREGEYLPDLMHEEIVSFIDDAGGRPFFVYYAYGLPHYPYQGDAKWLEHYRRQGAAYPRDLYAAFVSSMDERIGRLLDVLETRGLADNTVIIFQADHGHSTEERAHFGGGSAQGLRGAKFSLFEGGIRVPASITWPRRIPAGEVRGQFATGVDWMATIADIVGADTGSLDLDGHSLLPLIADGGAPSAYADYLWELDERWAVREGPWKLLIRPRDTTEQHQPDELPEADQQFLVNLDEDPFEQRNVAAEHPEVVARLLKIRDRHRATY
jgi:arylsulfatase A-like enzyme